MIISFTLCLIGLLYDLDHKHFGFIKQIGSKFKTLLHDAHSLFLYPVSCGHCLYLNLKKFIQYCKKALISGL